MALGLCWYVGSTLVALRGIYTEKLDLSRMEVIMGWSLFFTPLLGPLSSHLSISASSWRVILFFNVETRF